MAGCRKGEEYVMSATDSLAVQVTDATFAADVEQAEGLVLVDFWAT